MEQTMTQGNLAGILIRFSIPLVLSGILQQMYGWADAFIVGNLVGEDALAAVGATVSLYNLFVLVVTGLTLGVSILAAQMYGRGEREGLRQAAEGTADWLERLGLLNDGEYAKAVARHYAAKGYGPRKIRDELYRRGVPRESWEDALLQSESQAGRLDELVSKRMRGEEPTRENLKRTSDYLARRGFSWEEIAAALERYREEMEE